MTVFPNSEFFEKFRVFFFFFFVNFFIYSWLCWVSIAEGLFSSCGEQGLLSSSGTQASHCGA